MSSRVLRSAKGKVREHGTRGLVMGPIRNWGKKAIIVSGGTQFTLEGVTGWKSKERFSELEPTLGKAANKGTEIFEKDNGALHQMWLKTEGGEIVAITAEAVEYWASDIRGLIRQE